MAELIPPVAGRVLASDAERKIADRLRNELPTAARVLHSVGFVHHSKKRWAEADFVVVSEHGVFCLEVKGGRVGRLGGQWTFTDRDGRVSTKFEGPFDQAGGAAGSLAAWLHDERVQRNDGSKVEVGYGVITPDCELDVHSPDVEGDLLVDARTWGESLETFMGRLGVYWQQRSGTAALAPDEIVRIAAAVRPDFESGLSSSLVVKLVEEDLVRLNEAQLRLVEGLEDNERLIVRGAAGTGKSMLAMAEAMRLAASGRRVLLVCHTGVLARELLARTGGGVEVSTAAAHMWSLVRSGGLEGEVPDSTADALFDLHLPPLAIRASEGSSAVYDAVIIDEGQDLLRGEGGYLGLLDLLLVGGFAEGCWRVFLDPNQNLFGWLGSAPLALLRSGSPAEFRLRGNCRNTVQIAEQAQILSGADFGAGGVVEGPPVEICDRWDEPWIVRAADHVQRFLGRGIPTKDIAVLAVSRQQAESMIALDPDLFSARPAASKVRVSTIAGFKGLEASAIVLVGLWSLDEPHLRQSAYIGCTRAKVELCVVAPPEAKESFNRRQVEFVVGAIRAAEEARRPSAPEDSA